MRTQELVQLVEHDPGADTDGPIFEIQIGDLAIVPREINDEPLANGAAYEARAGPAWNHLNPGMGGSLDYGAGLTGVARKSDCQGFDLVNRGVSCVKVAGERIKRDLTVRGGEERLLLRRGHRTCPAYPACIQMTIRKENFQAVPR